MTLDSSLSVVRVTADDFGELCRFWSRHRARLAPHLLLPDSENGWSRCLDDSTARWYVGRLEAEVVSVGVLARISEWPWCSGEVGVGVDPSVRDRGVGRNTLRAILAAGFRDGLARIEALVDPRNLPSMRMVAAAGMVNEGVSKAVLEFDGVRVDAARWAIVST